VDLGARVVDLHDPKSVDAKGKLDAARVKTMLHQGLKELTGTSDLAGAWRVLLPNFTPDLRIGIKVNTAYYKVAPSPELTKALVDTLVADLGATPDKIFIWDRTAWDPQAAGLTTATTGAQITGTTPASVGPGFETIARSIAGGTTHFSKVLTETTDITLNLAVFKDHGIAGITGALKNIYGCIDNPATFHNNLQQALPEIYGQDVVRRSMNLCLIEGFLCIADGGPVSPPSHMPGRLFMAMDPLALDSHALSVLNSLRKTPIPASMVAWMDKAASLGIGSTKPEVIKRTLG